MRNRTTKPQHVRHLRSGSFADSDDFMPRDGCPECKEHNALCYKHLVIKYNYIKYLLDDLSSAILREGPNPQKHRRIMRKHRRQWPTLWRKIDRLTEWRSRH